METLKFKNFSENHPELKEGEIWFANMLPAEVKVLDFTTKRIGEMAYDMRGNRVQGLVPVFISHEEWHRRKFEKK
jgi:hypothetical protein